MTEGRSDHRHCHRACGKQLGGPAAAQQTRKRGCANHKQSRRDQARQAERQEVVRCQFGSKPGQQRRKQRLIRITPRQPLAG
jgi:hypothetical protein